MSVRLIFLANSCLSVCIFGITVPIIPSTKSHMVDNSTPIPIVLPNNLSYSQFSPSTVPSILPAALPSILPQVPVTTHMDVSVSSRLVQSPITTHMDVSITSGTIFWILFGLCILFCCCAGGTTVYTTIIHPKVQSTQLPNV